MAADRDDVRKKNRDPILTVGAVVLILAFTVVIGIYVNDHYIADSEASPARVGDKVSVNYVGSYYGYYTDDGSQVFDTSLWSVADNDDYSKSFEFTVKSESSYSPISFTIGGTDSYLAMFKNSVVGLISGQSTKVKIPPSEGYGELTEDKLASYSMTTSIDRVEVVTLDTLKNLYGISSISGDMKAVSPYGWDVNVKYDGNGSTAIVEHLAVINGEYDMNDDVSINVTSILGDKIGFEYVFDTIEAEGTIGFDSDKDGTDETYNNIRLVKIVVDNESRYVTAVDDVENPTTFITKSTDEKTGMYLYFTLTLV